MLADALEGAFDGNYLAAITPRIGVEVAKGYVGIFLGALGVHNFYAGYTKKGAIQLCLTLLTCFYGAAISWPWAIIEICVINKDAEGNQFV